MIFRVLFFLFRRLCFGKGWGYLEIVLVFCLFYWEEEFFLRFLVCRCFFCKVVRDFVVRICGFVVGFVLV